jgi:hypothetical protein
MNTMNTKLADSLTHFDDAVSVESCLMKYKVGWSDMVFFVFSDDIGGIVDNHCWNFFFIII